MSTMDQLKDALVDANGDWLLEYWGPDADRFIGDLSAEIEAFRSEYNRRFGERPDPFALLASDPFKARAFFQTDTLKASLEFRIMIWRILLGCEIRAIDFEYQIDGTSRLRVTLQAAPDGETDPVYVGDPFRDFAVLRHFGTSGEDGRLVLQGYYAFRV